MVKTYQVALTGTPVRLSTALFGTDEAQNIPFRQLLISASGADAFIGGTSAGAATGLRIPFPLANYIAPPYSLGPFSTGPLKLSDLYAIGAGATLTILGVPF